MLSQVIPRGKLPVKKTVVLLEEENFELRQSFTLPVESAGVLGPCPGP